MDYVSDEELARLEAIAARARQLALGQAPSQNYYQQGGWGAGGGNGVVNPEAIARWKAEQAANAAKLAGMQSAGGGLPQDPAYDVSQPSVAGPVGFGTPVVQPGQSPEVAGALAQEWRRNLRSSTGQPLTMAPTALGPDNWREKLAAMREPPRAGGILLSDALARASSRKRMRNRMSDMPGVDTPEGHRVAALAEQAAEQRFAGEAGAPLLARTSSDTPAAARRKILLAAARAGRGPTDTQPSDLTTARNPVTYAMDLAARKVAATEKAHQRQLARRVRLGGPGVLMAEMMKRGGNGAGGEGGQPNDGLQLIPAGFARSPQEAKLVNEHNNAILSYRATMAATNAETKYRGTQADREDRNKHQDRWTQVYGSNLKNGMDPEEATAAANATVGPYNPPQKNAAGNYEAQPAPSQSPKEPTLRQSLQQIPRLAADPVLQGLGVTPGSSFSDVGSMLADRYLEKKASLDGQTLDKFKSFLTAQIAANPQYLEKAKGVTPPRQWQLADALLRSPWLFNERIKQFRAEDEKYKKWRDKAISDRSSMPFVP